MLIRNLRSTTVVVSDPDFPPVTFGPDETVEVPDVLGRKMAEQTDRWKPEDKPARSKPADKKES
jgi:hypothetical protein